MHKSKFLLLLVVFFLGQQAWAQLSYTEEDFLPSDLDGAFSQNMTATEICDEIVCYEEYSLKTGFEQGRWVHAFFDTSATYAQKFVWVVDVSRTGKFVRLNLQGDASGGDTFKVYDLAVDGNLVLSEVNSFAPRTVTVYSGIAKVEYMAYTGPSHHEPIRFWWESFTSPYNFNKGATQCYTCQAGSVSSSDGSATCSACLPGFYQDLGHQSSCKVLVLLLSLCIFAVSQEAVL